MGRKKRGHDNLRPKRGNGPVNLLPEARQTAHARPINPLRICLPFEDQQLEANWNCTTREPECFWKIASSIVGGFLLFLFLGHISTGGEETHSSLGIYSWLQNGFFFPFVLLAYKKTLSCRYASLFERAGMFSQTQFWFSCFCCPLFPLQSPLREVEASKKNLLFSRTQKLMVFDRRLMHQADSNKAGTAAARERVENGSSSFILFLSWCNTRYYG